MVAKQTEFLPGLPLCYKWYGTSKMFELLGVRSLNGFAAIFSTGELIQEHIEKILYAGMLSAAPDLKLEDVPGKLNEYCELGHGYMDIITLLMEALYDAGILERPNTKPNAPEGESDKGESVSSV